MINGKVIYTPKGAALEYGRVGANFYTGCPHNCEYCYLKRGVIGKALGGTEVKLKKTLKDKETAYEIFKREAERHISTLRETGVFFSFSCDPLVRETRDLTFIAINFCIYNEIPVKVLTKCATFIESVWVRSGLFTSDIAREYVEFGFTLTGRDDMEPGASSNMERIEAMRRLHEEGFRTFASIEPVIDWQSAERVINDSIAVCDHYKIGLRSGVKKDYYKPVEVFEHTRAIVDFITERGKTVYLKHSVCNMIGDSNLFSYDDYLSIIRKTVDMDGKQQEVG